MRYHQRMNTLECLTNLSDFNMQKIIDITDRKHWSSALRAGASVYVDYTEEGFYARFFLDGKDLMCERKAKDGSTDIVRWDSNYLVQDAYQLGTIITKKDYDRIKSH